MSDPQPAPGKHPPRRAEPLQPDAPGSGDSAEAIDKSIPPPSADPNGATEKEAAKDKEQVENALRNVTKGYD